MLKEMEKPLFEYKESQKKERKEVCMAPSEGNIYACLYYVSIIFFISSYVASADNGEVKKAGANIGCWYREGTIYMKMLQAELILCMHVLPFQTRALFTAKPGKPARKV